MKTWEQLNLEATARAAALASELAADGHKLGIYPSARRELEKKLRAAFLDGVKAAICDGGVR